MLHDGGVGTLLIILYAYMGEAAWSTEPMAK